MTLSLRSLIVAAGLGIGTFGLSCGITYVIGTHQWKKAQRR